MNNNELNPFNPNDYIEKIIREVRETEDEFIFSAISPYINEITDMRISKHELKRLIPLVRPKPMEIVDGYDYCPTCARLLRLYEGLTDCYCKFCGQHIKRG